MIKKPIKISKISLNNHNSWIMDKSWIINYKIQIIILSMHLMKILNCLLKINSTKLQNTKINKNYKKSTRSNKIMSKCKIWVVLYLEVEWTKCLKYLKEKVSQL